MSVRPLVLLLPLCVALTVACDIDNHVAPVPAAPSTPAAPRRVLSALQVSPSLGALRPGATQQLSLVARDQYGAPITDRPIAYASRAPGIATVDGNGLVTAVAPGVVKIAASVTVDGSTVNATATIYVDTVSATRVVVTANPDGSWSPSEVSIKAGGTVVWVVPDSVGVETIWLDVFERNPQPLVFVDGVATHTYSSPGIFFYGAGDGFMSNEHGGEVRVY